MREGRGIFSWSNGNLYEGEWKEGNKNGLGTFTYLDGSKYKGEWKDGNCNG